MNWVKHGAIVILTAAVVVLAVQNLEQAPLRFLSWNVDVPISALTLVPLLLGLVTARLHGVVHVRRLRRRGETPSTHIDDRAAGLPPAAVASPLGAAGAGAS